MCVRKVFYVIKQCDIFTSKMCTHDWFSCMLLCAALVHVLRVQSIQKSFLQSYVIQYLFKRTISLARLNSLLLYKLFWYVYNQIRLNLNNIHHVSFAICTICCDLWSKILWISVLDDNELSYIYTWINWIARTLILI